MQLVDRSLERKCAEEGGCLQLRNDRLNEMTGAERSGDHVIEL